MIWTEMVEIATRPLPTETSVDRSGAIGDLLRALEGIDSGTLRDGLQTYANTMLTRSAPLRQAIGETHAAVKAADGEPPEDLIRRARDLLSGLLTG